MIKKELSFAAMLSNVDIVNIYRLFNPS